MTNDRHDDEAAGEQWGDDARGAQRSVSDGADGEPGSEALQGRRLALPATPVYHIEATTQAPRPTGIVWFSGATAGVIAVAGWFYVQPSEIWSIVAYIAIASAITALVVRSGLKACRGSRTPSVTVLCERVEKTKFELLIFRDGVLAIRYRIDLPARFGWKRDHEDKSVSLQVYSADTPVFGVGGIPSDHTPRACDAINLWLTVDCRRESAGSGPPVDPSPIEAREIRTMIGRWGGLGTALRVVIDVHFSLSSKALRAPVSEPTTIYRRSWEPPKWRRRVGWTVVCLGTLIILSCASGLIPAQIHSPTALLVMLVVAGLLLLHCAAWMLVFQNHELAVRVWRHPDDRVTLDVVRSGWLAERYQLRLPAQVRYDLYETGPDMYVDCGRDSIHSVRLSLYHLKDADWMTLGAKLRDWFDAQDLDLQEHEGEQRPR
jgi:hypothetical protein